MVALQILVLSAKVRILLGQQILKCVCYEKYVVRNAAHHSVIVP